jgi:phosphoribosylformimino-5-aminoimidazole carboxamide ribotide isomerase
MLVIPAIDLKDGRCVRLRQGDMRAETVYSDDPVAMARHWEEAGARLLHVVDLDGAVEGEPKNTRWVEGILDAVSVPVQVGGGIRTLAAIRKLMASGASRVVVGTAVLEDSGVLDAACAEFPGRILVGLDVRDGKVATRGWTVLSDRSPTELVRTLSRYALAGIIHTDIAKDGMLEGPNLSSLREIVACSPFPVIASGGISRLADLHAIKALGPRIEGAIVGKALYDGKLELKVAALAAS